ncbi:MAG: hypothetical protein PHN64_00075 [Desulfovibrionaceae bacterium]|nr:hypothetical protein [Desulfovibrionaceae bacterium]
MLCFSLLRRSLCSALLACLCALPALAAQPMPARLSSASLAVSACMDWMLDPSGALTVEEIINMPESFKPLGLQPMPHEAGTVWLRFTIPAMAKGAEHSSPLLLDIGSVLPGTPTLYSPQVQPQPEKPLLESKNKTEKETKPEASPLLWNTVPPDRNGIFMLPEAQSNPQLCFIRLEGAPGPWFSPTVRTPHDAATTLDKFAYPAVLVALGIALLLCLLRAASERGQWRLWAGMYTLAALGHALTGIPSTPAGHIPMEQAVALLSPGLALMLFAHVGRHVMQTSRHSTLLDSQYIILSLPGAALVMLPLIPGFAWLVRYFPLWPVLTLLLLPSTLGAWLAGLVGARRFLLACLLPPIGVALSMALPASLLAPEVLSTLPLWGVALSTLIIAGTSRQELPHAEALSPQTTKYLDDAPLSMKPTATQGLSLTLPQSGELNLAAPTQAMPELALPHTSPRAASPQLNEEEPLVFNLQQVLRDVHDKALPLAAPRNIGLSWYMPPQMGHWYIGYPQSLTTLLSSLLESAIAATRQGTIQIAARRMPDSVDAGLLLFSVNDTGAGAPPAERPTEALLHVWEMTRARNGFLNMESSETGTSIAFSMHCKPVEQEAASPQAPALQNILLVDESLSNRQLLRYFLENMPYALHEARTPAEAVASQQQQAAALLIFDGHTDAAHLAAAAQEIRHNEYVQHRPAALLLAITEDEHAWEMLHHAGFTHAMAKPLTRKALRNTVQELLPINAQPAATKQATHAPAASLLPDLSLEAEHKPSAFEGLMPQQNKSAAEHQPAAEEKHNLSDTVRTLLAHAPLCMEAPAAQPAPSLDLHMEETKPVPSNEAERTAPSLKEDAPLSMGEPASPAAEAASEYLPHHEAYAMPEKAMQAEPVAPQHIAQPQTEQEKPQAVAAPLQDTPFAPAQERLASEPAAQFVATQAQQSEQNKPTHVAAQLQHTEDEEPISAPATQLRSAEKAGAVAPLRNAGSEPYTGSYVFDEDALRDPTIRLLMPTAEDLAQFAPPAPPQEEPAQPASAVEMPVKIKAQPPLPQQVAQSEATEQVHAVAATPAAAQAQPVQPQPPLASQPLPASEAQQRDKNLADVELTVPVQPFAAKEPSPLHMPKPAPRPSHDPVAAALERVQALLGKRRNAVQEEAEKSLPETQSTPTLPQQARGLAAPAPSMPKPNQSAVCMPHTTQEPVQRQGAPIQPKPETQPVRNDAHTAPAQTLTIHSAPLAAPAQILPVQEAPHAAVAYTATLHSEATHSAPQAVPVQKASVHSEAVAMPVRKASQAASVQFEPVHPAPAHKALTQAPSVQASPAPEASTQFEDSVREMLVAIEADMRLIRQALAAGDMASTGRHAGFIANSADRHGLRVLARMARCVESAAKALDDDALHNLLPELEAAVERNRIALTQAK